MYTYGLRASSNVGVLSLLFAVVGHVPLHVTIPVAWPGCPRGCKGFIGAARRNWDSRNSLSSFWAAVLTVSTCLPFDSLTWKWKHDLDGYFYEQGGFHFYVSESERAFSCLNTWE